MNQSNQGVMNLRSTYKFKKIMTPAKMAPKEAPAVLPMLAEMIAGRDEDGTTTAGAEETGGTTGAEEAGARVPG